MVFIRDKFGKQAIILRRKVNNGQFIKIFYQARLIGFYCFTNKSGLILTVHSVPSPCRSWI